MDQKQKPATSTQKIQNVLDKQQEIQTQLINTTQTKGYLKNANQSKLPLVLNTITSDVQQEIVAFHNRKGYTQQEKSDFLEYIKTLGFENINEQTINELQKKLEKYPGLTLDVGGDGNCGRFAIIYSTLISAANCISSDDEEMKQKGIDIIKKMQDFLVSFRNFAEDPSNVNSPGKQCYDEYVRDVYEDIEYMLHGVLTGEISTLRLAYIVNSDVTRSGVLKKNLGMAALANYIAYTSLLNHVDEIGFTGAAINLREDLINNNTSEQEAEDLVTECVFKMYDAPDHGLRQLFFNAFGKSINAIEISAKSVTQSKHDDDTSNMIDVGIMTTTPKLLSNIEYTGHTTIYLSQNIVRFLNEQVQNYKITYIPEMIADYPRLLKEHINDVSIEKYPEIIRSLYWAHDRNKSDGTLYCKLTIMLSMGYLIRQVGSLYKDGVIDMYEFSTIQGQINDGLKKFSDELLTNDDRKWISSNNVVDISMIESQRGNSVDQSQSINLIQRNKMDEFKENLDKLMINRGPNAKNDDVKKDNTNADIIKYAIQKNMNYLNRLPQKMHDNILRKTVLKTRGIAKQAKYVIELIRDTISHQYDKVKRRCCSWVGR